MATAERKYGAQLQSLIDAGHVRVDGTQVLGKASDGTEVILGDLACLRDQVSLGSYLKSHPTPDTW